MTSHCTCEHGEHELFNVRNSEGHHHVAGPLQILPGNPHRPDAGLDGRLVTVVIVITDAQFPSWFREKLWGNFYIMTVLDYYFLYRLIKLELFNPIYYQIITLKKYLNKIK